MDQGKVAHYRNQNVRFDVEFIVKRNDSLGTGGAKPEDHWICIAHLNTEDMLKPEVTGEKKFKNIECE